MQSIILSMIVSILIRSPPPPSRHAASKPLSSGHTSDPPDPDGDYLTTCPMEQDPAALPHVDQTYEETGDRMPEIDQHRQPSAARFL